MMMKLMLLLIVSALVSCQSESDSVVVLESADGSGVLLSDREPETTQHIMTIVQKKLVVDGKTKSLLMEVSTGKRYLVDDVAMLLGVRSQDEERYVVKITKDHKLYGIDPVYRTVELRMATE